MNTNDATRATAEAMPAISRRRFLLNTTMASAAVAVAVPAVAAEPAMTPREQAIWHMRELERLLFEDGATTANVIVIGMYGGHNECKLLGIYPGGRLVDRDRLFAREGGAA